MNDDISIIYYQATTTQRSATSTEEDIITTIAGQYYSPMILYVFIFSLFLVCLAIINFFRKK